MNEKFISSSTTAPNTRATLFVNAGEKVMTVEQWIADLIVQLPNLAVALLVLWWQRMMIDKLLEHQHTLIDKLIQMVDDVRDGAALSLPARNPGL